MTTSDDGALIKYGDLMQRLQLLAARTEEESGTVLKNLLQDMSDLLGDVLSGQTQLVDAALPPDDSPGEIEILQLQVETLRLRMVGAILAQNSDPSQLVDGPLGIRVGTLVSTPSGLTYGKVGAQCVVLLPPSFDSSTVGNFGNEMVEVYDFALTCRGIVFDCSAVKVLPNIIQALLLGYRHNFVILGKEFSVLWLHQSALSAGSLDQVTKAFGAEEIGGYLFARI